ncbi:nucleoside-diphosphate-sugar epimerase [Mycolicibacterium chubuense NBB4]|uniref:Nucleoside-diphosphate-sugar epimerase n=1 Tax=Mycolicibacterium chubuense (strain NBB4) TaxID=710421 RepID=I4BD18_MYCCN|nr:NAD-dependent epimerase/dehydratase family protein [Mycolicibacterium chubuense]AFM15175.1 nucleoside-diphosphate-sugar epimerase [Mycolicibacterium chubuense NBB4]
MTSHLNQRRRILVTGASGNVGAGVLRALARSEPDAELVGVCRRPPTAGALYEGMRWHAVDLSTPSAASELAPAMRDVDVVIHLALAVQPVDDEEYLYRANVLGTQAVLEAMRLAGVSHLVYASSLGVYAPSRSATPVSETWPASGQSSSTYSRHKVVVETLLDQFEIDQPDILVARFRPTVVVQRDAAFEIRSLYLGPFIPRAAVKLLQRRLLPILPLPKGLALQFVHADDVGDAVVRLMQQRAQGSYNIAADALDCTAIASLVGARPVEVSPPVMRTAVTALHRFRAVAVTPGWYDVATRSPVMDTTKARQELGWQPARSSTGAARELIDGLADGAVGSSPALGSGSDDRAAGRRVIDRVHDATLALWCAAAVARAPRRGRPGALHAALIAANLISGTPAALDRVRAGRRDPVALLAPVAVGGAVLSSARGGWTAAAATMVLGVLGLAERRRALRAPRVPTTT